jgi:hypothetical protein
VRQPQQHYARTAGWVAQRFALLDHWKTRYGSDEDGTAARTSLVFSTPGQPIGEAGRVLSSPTQLARTVQPADIPQPRAEAEASSSPPEQFRIKRRGAAPAVLPQPAALPSGWRNFVAPAESDTATSSSAASAASSRGAGKTEASASSQAEGGEFRAVDIPARTPQAMPTPSTVILPKPFAGNVIAAPDMAGNVAFSADRSSPRVAIALSTATASAPTPSPVNVRRAGAIQSPLPLRLQRQASEAATGLARAQALPIPATTAPIAHEAATGLARAQALPIPATTAPTAHMPWSQSSASPAYEPSLLAGGEGARSEITNAVAEQAQRTGIVASLATVVSPDALPPVQRQPAGNARATDIAPGDVVDRQAARAAEIRAVSSGASTPAMVWRQSAEGSSSRGAFAAGVTGGARSTLPLAMGAAHSGEPQVARQATTVESTPPTPTASTTPAAATPGPAIPPAQEPPAQEIDIERLADQVSAVLGQRLEIERERRGMTGWH